MEDKSGRKPESNSIITLRRTTYPSIVGRPQPSPLQRHHEVARALTNGDIEVAQALFFQFLHTDNYDPNSHPIPTLLPYYMIY